MNPTPAQLAAANLVAVTEMNGHPVRKWDWVRGNFPPTTVYVTPATPVPTPTPTPVPTPGIYPSGLTPPPVQARYTRSFDDFTSTTLGPLWYGAYNGQSHAAQVGIFLGSHLVLKGDSWLRLQAYPDPANALNSWMATPAIAASVNQWCGAGVQSATRWPVGTIFTWACKWDTYPGMTPIVLTMGNNWPPEQDIIEADVSTKGDPVTGFSESFLYAPGPTQVQHGVSGPDFSQPHIWQTVWTATGTTVYVDGKVIDNVAFSPAMLSGTNGLQNPQFIAFQHQTGDPDNPPADPTITAANPITFYVDWVAIDVPA